jgi:hypothetical protein
VRIAINGTDKMGPGVRLRPLLHRDGSGHASGCVEGVTEDLIEEIGNNPEAFYVNLHNAAFPGGAIRGNLEDNEEGI